MTTDQPTPPEIQATDDNGNVRPADERFLTPAQKRAVTTYKNKVTDEHGVEVIPDPEPAPVEPAPEPAPVEPAPEPNGE